MILTGLAGYFSGCSAIAEMSHPHATAKAVAAKASFRTFCILASS
jgi:hypothetical protein